VEKRRLSRHKHAGERHLLGLATEVVLSRIDSNSPPTEVPLDGKVDQSRHQHGEAHDERPRATCSGRHRQGDNEEHAPKRGFGEG